MYSYIFLPFLTPNQPFVTRAPNRYRPCSPPSWRDQRRRAAHLEVPGYTRGTRFWGILFLFRGWIRENYGKSMGKHMETYYAKTCMYYTANELACLVSGCPSTHHCRRTPTGSVRRTAAVQTNKCKWTTSKHIEENTKIIQKLSELLSREETKHELSSTLLLFGLTEEHFHGISWLPSAVLLKTIMKPHCPAVSARSSSGLVLQPQLHGSMTLHNHQTVQGCEHPHHPHLRVSGAMKMHESTRFFWKQLGEVKPTLYIGYMESNTVWYSMVCFHQLVAFSFPVTGKVYLNGTIPSGLV